SELAVRGEDVVLALESERAADLRRFLPHERRVHRELALTLQRRALEVRPARDDHEPQQLAQVLVLQAEVRRFHGRLARFPDHAIRGLRGGRSRRVHHTARGPAVERPGTQYRRRRLIRSMRAWANRSAASDVGMSSCWEMAKTSRSVR